MDKTNFPTESKIIKIQTSISVFWQVVIVATIMIAICAPIIYLVAAEYLLSFLAGMIALAIFARFYVNPEKTLTDIVLSQDMVTLVCKCNDKIAKYKSFSSNEIKDFKVKMYVENSNKKSKPEFTLSKTAYAINSAVNAVEKMGYGVITIKTEKETMSFHIDVLISIVAPKYFFELLRNADSIPNFSWESDAHPNSFFVQEIEYFKIHGKRFSIFKRVLYALGISLNPFNYRH